MTKLKVDEIEAISTNQNVQVKTGGDNGALEIQSATNDGTFQLNCSAQSHGVKLKAPSSTASQNYTMVLPDNQIAASKFLKVKSITGSGSTAVGQLEYADAPSSSLPNLDAANFTSGTVPSARMPSFTGAGLGLKLISKTVIAYDNSISNVDLNLDSNSAYHLIGKNIMYANNSGVQTSYPRIRFANSSGTFMNTYHTVYVGGGGFTNSDVGSYYNSSNIDLHADQTPSKEKHYNFTAEIITGDGGNYGGNTDRRSNSWMYLRGFFTAEAYSKTEVLAHYADASIIDLVRISSVDGYPFRANTEFLLYKFMES